MEFKEILLIVCIVVVYIVLSYSVKYLCKNIYRKDR